MTNKEYIKYTKLIKDYAYNNYTMMFRAPDGVLKHPFIVPGSCYSNTLWDWDSWITNIAIRQILADKGEENSIVEYEKGCIINFIEHIREDGVMPIVINPEGVSFPEKEKSDTSFHKPCLAQHIAFIMGNNDDCEWIEDYLPELELFLNAYMTKCRHENGLYFWLDDTAIGVDNDPCTFYRPKHSSASIFLNCMMYKELEATEFIFEKVGMTEKAEKYKSEKCNLKNAIQDKLWDEKDGFFYSADLNLLPIDLKKSLHSGVPRNWDSLIQRIGVWSGMLAMWAKIATPGQAERMVKENYLDERTFNAPYGIRTLSKLEKMYQIVKTGNPSCWLGPIWGISNYFTFKALLNYGYSDEAKELAYKCVELYGKDIEQNGEMHEYYDPETGIGVNNPGFQNWNFLVLNMMAYLEGREAVSEF